MSGEGDGRPVPLRFARALRRGVSALAAGMAYAAGWNYIACALFITADILGRNLLGVSSAATVEVTGYMLAGGIAWALAHALARGAHIRVDVWVNRLPLRARAALHLLALSLLGAFGAFSAWAAWSLVDESLLFDAHDNSALRLPLAVPQGVWLFGLLAFCGTVLVLAAEAALLLLSGRPGEVDRLLGSRTVDDEAAEAVAAAAMARSAVGRGGA